MNVSYNNLKIIARGGRNTIYISKERFLAFSENQW
jgi:hypothetical protein